MFGTVLEMGGEVHALALEMGGEVNALALEMDGEVSKINGLHRRGGGGALNWEKITGEVNDSSHSTEEEGRAVQCTWAHFRKDNGESEVIII